MESWRKEVLVSLYEHIERQPLCSRLNAEVTEHKYLVTSGLHLKHAAVTVLGLDFETWRADVTSRLMMVVLPLHQPISLKASRLTHPGAGLSWIIVC